MKGIKYKSDFIEMTERWKKWWNREDIGRCAISIKANKPVKEGDAPPPLPEKVEDRWLNFEYLKEKVDYVHRNTEYIGEAFPIWCGGHPGHEFLPAYYGCETLFGEDTGWTMPIIEKGNLSDYDPSDIKISSENKWWKFSQKYRNFINECTEGKSLPMLPAMGATGDTLAAMRSTEKLLYDVIDEPEAVKRFEDKLMDDWIKNFEHFYNMHKERNYGGTTEWLSLWAPGKMYVTQNDFSYMISTKMYERIFLDALLKQIDYLDYPFYHVDGVEAFRHVDLLCSIKKLKGLQILPGAGKPSPLHYMDILKKVQAAGKNLHISLLASEVKYALENLSSKGLFIEVYLVAPRLEEGYDILKLAEKYSRFY